MGNRQLFPEKSAKELLVEFKDNGSQEPFEEIVRRYAAMVYGVCLRVTGDKHDAEDATQAVFLSLALQAKTSREIKYIGPWLQKVAHRLALDVKKAKTRRKKREDKLAEQARFNGNGHHNGNGRAFLGGNSHANPADHPGSEELKRIMMEELDKLPAKYRMPLVLHYFGGLSREEMAAELGCNPSTLGVRVHRGKAMLGTRLAKRGVAVSAIAMAVLLEHVIRSTTIAPMVSSSAIASNAAGLMASQGGAVVASARVIALVRTIARAVIYAKLKVALVALLAIGSAALTAGGAIAKYVDLQNLRLPTPGDLGKWIKPLFQGWIPSLQASAAGKEPTSDLPASPQNEPNPAGVVLPAAPDSPLSPRRDTALPPPPPRAGGVAEAPSSNPPELTALAQAILTPPVAPPSPAPRPADVQDRTTVGSDAPPSQSGDDDSAADDEERPTVLADVGSGDLHLGAGGGAAGGKVEEYILPPNTTLQSNHLVVGDTGSAVFRQNGGVNRVQGTLTVGKEKGSSGTYELKDGTLTARAEVVGDEGTGTFIQSSGTNIAQDSLIVGKGPGTNTGNKPAGGSKTATKAGGSNNAVASASNGKPGGFTGSAGSGGGSGSGDAAGVASADSRTEGAATGSATGTYTQSGGKTVVLNPFPTKDPSKDPNGLHLGENAGATGTYVLADGTLTADPQLVGNQGSGTLVQAGGTNTTGAVVVAADPGSTGLYDMSGGELVVQPRDDDATTPDAAIQIGGAGKGRFEFGGVNKTGSIYEVGAGGSSVVVRGEPSGTGVLTGFGPVNLTGALVNNGRIEADGFRQERDLDLSRFAYVTSSIENPRWGGDSGWFARREGRLKLPAVPVQKGNGTYTWGEDAGDPMIDLVNSVRLTIKGAQQAGDVAIALNSPVRDDLPTLPEGHRFIGIWSIDGSSLGGFDSVELEVRYDDGLARTLGLDEQLLKLWQYDGKLGAWERINDDSFSRNILDHILTGTAGGDLTFFAVSAPEPGGAVLLAVGAAALLKRRRRR